MAQAKKTVSINHAGRLAEKRDPKLARSIHVEDDGTFACRVSLDVKGHKLKVGRQQRVRAIPFTGGTLAAGARPEVFVEAGRVPTFEDVVVPAQGDETTEALFTGELPDLAGQDVDILVERVKLRAPWLLLLLLLLIGTVITGSIVLGWGDPRARRGYYDGKSDEEIQADLDSQVDWYSMEISIAAEINLREGETTAEARIENVEANHCDQKVKIYLADKPDDILFESGAIRPGEYIQDITLAHPLEVGTYLATVEFQGYEQNPTFMSDEGHFLGHNRFGASCAAEVIINVLPNGTSTK